VKTRALSTGLCALAFTAASGVARAETPVPAFSPDMSPEVLRTPITTTRRHGFMIGGTLALRIDSVSGYPTAFDKRNADNRVDMGTFLAPGESVFIGGAISDYLALAVDLEFTAATHGGVHRRGTTFGFKVLAWPLFDRGGLFRDLGIDATVGTGTANLSESATGYSIAQSGSFAFVATSVFWEALRAGGFNVGPAVGVDYRSSETYTAFATWLGVRGVYYGGP
jgi:hypothetical protein